jgi:hypothetical protein
VIIVRGWLLSWCSGTPDFMAFKLSVSSMPFTLTASICCSYFFASVCLDCITTFGKSLLCIGHLGTFLYLIDVMHAVCVIIIVMP